MGMFTATNMKLPSASTLLYIKVCIPLSKCPTLLWLSTLSFSFPFGKDDTGLGGEKWLSSAEACRGEIVQQVSSQLLGIFRQWETDQADQGLNKFSDILNYLFIYFPCLCIIFHILRFNRILHCMKHAVTATVHTQWRLKLWV